MSKIAWVLIYMLLSGKGHAQQDYFILVQSDNNQPFYVLRGDKSFSSSAQGHLILSQLKEGGNTMTIGFPGKLFPEQRYTISIRNQDLEYQLKNLGDKGWGLFNPRTLELKMPDKKDETAGRPGVEGVKKDDAFSRLMAGVVSDTAVMYNNYALEQVVKDSPTLALTRPAGPAAVPVQSDTSIIALGTTPIALDTATTLVEAKAHVQSSVDTTTSIPPPHRTGAVIKLSEKKGTRNWRGVFADRETGKKADTIIVIIPLDTAAVKNIAQVRTEHKEGIQKTTDSTKGPQTVADTPGSPLTATQPAAGETGEKKTPVRLVVANSDCRNFATDYDVDKLRVKCWRQERTRTGSQPLKRSSEPAVSPRDRSRRSARSLPPMPSNTASSRPPTPSSRMTGSANWPVCWPTPYTTANSRQ